MTNTRRTLARRERELTLIHAVMVCILILILVQSLLLMVAVEGFLGDHRELLLPAAAGSGLCFAGACWLIRYIVRRPAGEKK